MKSFQRKQHWENIFNTKDTRKVSWYQSCPETSLNLIENLHLPYSSSIIDVGCGDSYLPDFLLDKGFFNITLLDISEIALQTVKSRLNSYASHLKTIAADVLDFNSTEKYDLWHDRAVFHFLTDENEIRKYEQTATNKIKQGGYFILGTFSDKGPDKCSGLNVRQYSEDELSKCFSGNFTTLNCFTSSHETPSGEIQKFAFCIFQKN